MTNILQNVTKDNVLLQLKRIAVGGLITIPLVIVIGAIVHLSALGIITPELVLISTTIIFGTFMLWSIGGAYESYSDMRREQKKYKERKTLNAFKKLGHGEQYNGT
jgi:uncharacterized membrane protein